MVAFLRRMSNVLASSLLHPRSLTVLDNSTGRVVAHLSRAELASYPSLYTSDVEGLRRYLAGLPLSPDLKAAPVLVEEPELKIHGKWFEEGVSYPVRYHKQKYVVRKHKDGVLVLYELAG